MFNKYLDNSSNPDLIEMAKLEKELMKLTKAKSAKEAMPISTTSVNEYGKLENIKITALKFYKVNKEEIYFTTYEDENRNLAFQVYHQFGSKFPTKSVAMVTQELGTRYFHLIDNIKTYGAGRFLKKFIAQIKTDGISLEKKIGKTVSGKADAFLIKLHPESLMLSEITLATKERVFVFKYFLANKKQSEFEYEVKTLA